MRTHCSLHIPLISVAACGGVFNFSAGIITSPAYSYSDYPSDIYCVYNITVADDKVILLKYVSQTYLLKKIVSAPVTKDTPLITGI